MAEFVSGSKDFVSSCEIVMSSNSILVMTMDHLLISLYSGLSSFKFKQVYSSHQSDLLHAQSCYAPQNLGFCQTCKNSKRYSSRNCVVYLLAVLPGCIIDDCIIERRKPVFTSGKNTLLLNFKMTHPCLQLVLKTNRFKHLLLIQTILYELTINALKAFTPFFSQMKQHRPQNWGTILTAY